MDQLPIEIVTQISEFLTVKDFLAFRSVNRRLFDEASSLGSCDKILEQQAL